MKPTQEQEALGRKMAALSQAPLIVSGFSAISAANSAFNASHESYKEIQGDVCDLMTKLYIAIGFVEKSDDLQPLFAQLRETADATRSTVYGEYSSNILDSDTLEVA